MERRHPEGGRVQALAERAPAKINLSLAILGRRADGYHELESLVVFADLADRLELVPDAPLGLTLSGPRSKQCGPADDNLVLKAARALVAACGPLRLGRFKLAKTLPVAAGIGGGSADAAAALRLLARLNGIPLDDARLMETARAVGADVPVCLDPRPRIMCGIGEILSQPLAVPALPAVLVNPGVAVLTKDVFAALRLAPAERLTAGDGAARPPREQEAFWEFVAARRNDLEAPAIRLEPEIEHALTALRAARGCRLARMSGSGATCFGLFATGAAARAAARAIQAAHAHWWARATTLGASVAES